MRPAKVPPHRQPVVCRQDTKKQAKYMPAHEAESMCNVREANIFGAPLALHIFQVHVYFPHLFVSHLNYKLPMI